MPKELKFKIGEEVVFKLSGEKGYIVNFFRACLVKFKKGLRVIPERSLVHNEVVHYKEPKLPHFIKGDTVMFNTLRGEVVLSKRFYIVHLYKSGELKIVFSDFLAKKGTKILRKVILTSAPGQKLEHNIPGQGKIFSNN